MWNHHFWIICIVGFMCSAGVKFGEDLVPGSCSTNLTEECGEFNPAPLFNGSTSVADGVKKRFVDPTFRGNPKSQAEIWHRNFNSTSKFFDQSSSLVNLLLKITSSYLNACIPVILYDMYVMDSELAIVQKLLQVNYCVEFICWYIVFLMKIAF